MTRLARIVWPVAIAWAVGWSATGSAGSASPQTSPPPVPPATQAPARPAQEGASFRGGIELVALNVTATDGSGHYVTGLNADDFLVFEDNVKQDIGFFNRTSLPLAVALLLDSSASMEDKIRTAQTAALGFVRSLRAQDQAQVIDFDGRVSVVAPFTAARADVEKAITSTVAGGSTSLYNAIYIALKELSKTRSRSAEELRRQAIIVLSDGEDTSSLVSYDEVLEQAKRSETAIYAIGIRTRDPYSGKAYSDADYVLRQLTSQTGGRVFFPERIEELPAIYAQISEELSNQYMVGYTSSNTHRDGRWRRIAVRVTRPTVSARTRQGYYAPGGAGPQ
ncbi:MAG: VWA domain-containing protein [Acidobacteria bacterium]|nr:VWA domain-containing protein [Acidobacteriota bacterium]